MATNPPIHCHLCNEPLDPNEELEDHLLYEHEPRELANELVAQWEDDEFGDFE